MPPRAQRGTKAESNCDNHLSIEDFDINNPQCITEKESILALNKLHIDQNDLLLPSKQELKSFNDSTLAKMVLNHHYQRINKLVSQIKNERLKILRSEEKEQPVAKREVNLVTIENDILLLQKTKASQQREVEQMIATLIELDAMQKEQEQREMIEEEKRRLIELERKKKTEEAHRKHIAHIESMRIEQEKRAKEEENKRKEQYEREQKALAKQKIEAERKIKQMKILERKRREAAEANRAHLDQIEEERKAKLLEQQMRIEEREMKRLQMLEAEHEFAHRKREEEEQKRQKQIDEIRKQKLAEIESKRKEAEEKEALREERYKEFLKIKKAEQLQYKQTQEFKIRRNAQSRIKLAEERYKARASTATTDQDIDERIKAMMVIRERRAEDARLGRSDFAAAAIRRQQLWEEKTKAKESELRKMSEEKEMIVGALLNEREKNLRRSSVMRRLKEAEKAEAAARLELQQKDLAAERKKKLEDKLARADEVIEERKASYAERGKLLIKLDRERARLSDSFSSVRSSNRRDSKTLQAVADEYGLDYHEIEEKVAQRRATKIGSPYVLGTSRSSVSVKRITRP